jgi:regulator of protease activity HflC (stomatin/prohibitin superfamily)
MKGPIIGSILALGLVFCLMTFGWVNVHPTEVAVEINKVMGKVSEIPKGVGYHFFNRWVTDMVIYKVSSRAYPGDTSGNERGKDYTLELKTNDGQNISVDMTIIYSLKANEVPSLHQAVGQNYEDQILLPQIRSEARLVIGGYSAEEIYQGKVRDVIQQAIKDRLITTVAEYPAIIIHDALLRHFAFSTEFEKAIELKKMAAQQVEINKNKAAAQEQEALRQKAEATGFKFKAVQEAEGRAEAMKVEADAQRYKLEAEAAGNLARYKADAEGKRLSAEALGGGQNVVNLAFAEKLAPTLQVWGIPVGQTNTSLMDVSGIFGKMLEKKE